MTMVSKEETRKQYMINPFTGGHATLKYEKREWEYLW